MHFNFDEIEAEIRKNIGIGREQLDHGKGIPGEQVFSELRRRNKTFSEKQSNKNTD